MGRSFVPARLGQDFKNFAFIVDSAPQICPLATNADKNLIKMPGSSPRKTYAAAKDAAARCDQANWYRGRFALPHPSQRGERRSGLDFLAVTDHNTTAQWRYFGLASSSD